MIGPGRFFINLPFSREYPVSIHGITYTDFLSRMAEYLVDIGESTSDQHEQFHTSGTR
jgi:hypothetical protein